MILLPAIFTLDIGGRPTLAFEAKNLRESQQLCHEYWLRRDIAGLITVHPYGMARRGPGLGARPRTKIATYRGAARDAAPAQGELLLACLVKLDAPEEAPDQT
jgi:hypothetical protein